MSERLPEKFIVIPRHAFYDENIVNKPDLPFALSETFNPQAPEYSKPDVPSISNMIEYLNHACHGWKRMERS